MEVQSGSQAPQEGASAIAPVERTSLNDKQALERKGYMPNQLKVSLENIIPLTEARDHFSQIVTEVQKDKLYVLTKGGKPAVAIIDVKYLEHLTGGELKKEHIQEEIKKAPEKVGLPPMIDHDLPKASPTSPAPSPTTLPVQPKTQTDPTPKPLVTPPINNTPPKPAGFAAPPTPPKPEPPKSEPVKQTPPISPQYNSSIPPLDTKPTPPPAPSAPTPPPPAPHSSPAPAPLKTPPAEDKIIDVQIRDDKSGEENSQKEKMTSLDDKTPPAQYAGDSEEPDDMSID